MKEIVNIGLNWNGYYPHRPKSQQERNSNRRLIEKTLNDMGYGHIIQSEVSYYNLKLEKGDRALNILLESLNQRPDLVSPFIQVSKKYSHQELDSADLLLWRATNQVLEDDYYDPYTGKSHEVSPYLRYCETCRAPLGQIRPLVVNKRLMGKRHISGTYRFETILTERVAHLFQQAGLTGYELLPVKHYAKPYMDEPVLYQLKINNILPEMAAPPTEFERLQRCDVCGMISKYIKHTHYWGNIQYIEDTDIYYSRNVLEGIRDFNLTSEYFGDLPTMHREIIITQQVLKALKENKVKDWEVVPVYLIDS